MTIETANQRHWRLVRERQEAREKRMKAERHAKAKALRAEARSYRMTRAEKAASDWLVSDHNHDMDS